jgi:hypothetical protein
MAQTDTTTVRPELETTVMQAIVAPAGLESRNRSN